MALEDAKMFNQDTYALIVDFTSAFNTTDHDKLLIIMFDLKFLTDAIDIVKNLYQQASTRVRLPPGTYTPEIPVERGTIQGDTFSPFLFLIYIEPLLRWLHVGNRGYTHACCHCTTSKQDQIKNTTSSGAFADDLICLAKSFKIYAYKPKSLWLFMLNPRASKAFLEIPAWPYVIIQLVFGGQPPRTQCAWN
eukprot:413977-Pelagomonas_calceolata.AAC.1